MQRTFDIFFAGIALISLSPLFLFLILLLRTTGEREIFFSQCRVGRGGKTFKLYKFATMLKDSPVLGTGTVTVKNDPRVLPVGVLLRKTKVNELPQLINILKGDMSIIGPRPQTERCFDAFPTSMQCDIGSVRPGLSGIGSIVFRSEEEMLQTNNDPERLYDHVIMPYKAQLESWYVRNASIWNYFLFIALTIFVMISHSSRFVFRLYKSLPRPPAALSYFISSDYYE